jgi:hypothetical protein
VGPYIPYDLPQKKGETCAKFGGDRFRNVDLYKVQTNKHRRTKTISSLYIQVRLEEKSFVIMLSIFGSIYGILSVTKVT